jgi:hypothetical protein
VQASSYSLQSSMELLQKDVVQLHAPRYQSMRRVSHEPGFLPLGKPTKTMYGHSRPFLHVVRFYFSELKTLRTLRKLNQVYSSQSINTTALDKHFHTSTDI